MKTALTQGLKKTNFVYNLSPSSREVMFDHIIDTSTQLGPD